MPQHELMEEPSEDDLLRVRAILARVGGPQVSWGAVNALEVLLTERRMEAERRASARLTRATWALVIATVGLVLATVVLVGATMQQM